VQGLKAQSIENAVLYDERIGIALETNITQFVSSKSVMLKKAPQACCSKTYGGQAF